MPALSFASRDKLFEPGSRRASKSPCRKRTRRHEDALRVHVREMNRAGVFNAKSRQAAVTVPSHDRNCQHRSLSIPGPLTANGRAFLFDPPTRDPAEFDLRETLFSFASSPPKVHKLRNSADQTMATVLFQHAGKFAPARTKRVSRRETPSVPSVFLTRSSSPIIYL